MEPPQTGGADLNINLIQDSKSPSLPTSTESPHLLAATKQPSEVHKSVVLRKPPLIASSNLSTGNNVLKFYPKASAIPLKSLQGPNGNIIVHGPNNKILSLQIKKPQLSASGQSSGISLLTFKKDKNIPGITLIAAPQQRNKDGSVTKIVTMSSTSTSSSMVKTTATIVPCSGKTLEIKPITITNSPKPLTPAQAATVPIPISAMQKKITLSKILKSGNILETSLKNTFSVLKPVTNKDQLIATTIQNAAPPILIPITTSLAIPISTAASITEPSKSKPMPILTSSKLSSGSISVSKTAASNPLQILVPVKLAKSNSSAVSISPTRLSPILSPMDTVASTESVQPLSTAKNSLSIAAITTQNAKDSSDQVNCFNSKENSSEKTKTSLDKEEKREESNLLEDTSDESLKDSPNSKSSDQLIRVKSIETLIQLSEKNVVLKNKSIEDLQRSPRLAGRSKSLNTDIKMKNLQVKRSLRRKSFEPTKNNGKTVPPKLTASQETVTVNSADPSLLCMEKIETSPSESKTRSSDESSSSTTPSDQNLSEEVKTEVDMDIEAPPQDPPVVILPETATEDIKPLLSDFDAFNILKWSNGIGALEGTDLHFQFNEFGLIEIVDRHITDIQCDDIYEKPIYEREYLSQKISDYSDPLYYCKGCKCHGAAVDFLEPDFCSHECIQTYQKIGIQATRRRDANPKKYSNRRKASTVVNQTEQPTWRSFPAVPDETPKIIDTKNSRSFSWDTYLKYSKSEPAPIDLFLNPFPCSANGFQAGMKLEAIDPENSSLFCVCTVVEKRGYRLKLHFDGYSKYYDFWVNADSMDIFPPGWCLKTNRILQPPKAVNAATFNWPMYLNLTRSVAAPRGLFTHLNSSSNTNRFRSGMKLEADDIRNTGKVCVATVADVLDNRILVHFDGWDECYNYWIDISSPYIHPIDWHKRNSFSIVAPPDWQDQFTWKAYLADTKTQAASEDRFVTRPPINFKVGMKLEVVDKKNPYLIRPATVIMTDEYEVKLLFDGWPVQYAFWIEDDNPDIHPIGWCQTTEHDLEPPPGFDSGTITIPCDMPGCRGVGNSKRFEINFHTEVSACPYLLSNWSKEIDRAGRVKNSEIIDEATVNKSRKRTQTEIPEVAVPVKKSKLNAMVQEERPSTINTPIKATKDILKVTRQLLCDYGPRLQQSYALWKQNSDKVLQTVDMNIKKNPLLWTADEISDCIAKLPRCQGAAKLFIEEEIDGAAFLSIQQNDLTDRLKINLGPAIKIYNLVIQLREIVVTKFSGGFNN